MYVCSCNRARQNACSLIVLCGVMVLLCVSSLLLMKESTAHNSNDRSDSINSFMTTSGNARNALGLKGGNSVYPCATASGVVYTNLSESLMISTKGLHRRMWVRV